MQSYRHVTCLALALCAMSTLFILYDRKVHHMKESVEHFKHHPHHRIRRSLEPAKTGKIAFLFLLQGAFPTYKIWTDYLGSAPRDQRSLYVHLPPGESEEAVPPFFRDFVLDEKDRRKTSYCTDLVSATMALISAALKDPSNQKFILMSPTHIPVKPFALVHELLFRDDNTWLCLSPTSLWTSTRAGQERPKHHQWFVLSRKHAEEQARASHPQIKAKSGCHDETWIYPPPMNLTEESVRAHGGRPWPGVNDGILRTRGVASTAGLDSVDTTFLAPARISRGVAGRCSAYVFWSCGWCNMSDMGASATSPFTAIGPYWGNTSVGKRHELDMINYCLLQFMVNGTDFLFARKIFHGARVVRDCLGSGLPTVTVEAALRMLRVLP